MSYRRALLAATTSLLATAAAAQQAPALEGDALSARLSLLGQVQPRAARDIARNDWSIGAEAIDRDYSTFAAWRPYLGPLGAKHARLQSGWGRTDLGGGRYDFSWLDPIIDGMLADGVQPWLELSYGNDRYAGGGVPRRDSPLPSGAGLQAWLAYATATAERYRGKVREYEIWNEPDLVAGITAEGYGRFAYETAQSIKRVDPDAGIIFGVFAGSVWDRLEGRAWAKTSLQTFAALGGKAKAVTYHAYNPNPDAVYAALPSFIQLVHAIDPAIEVRQGENGAPSLNQQHYALRNMWWTEESQAKWMLRRMLGDAGHDVPTSVFTITEMHYPVAAETGLAFSGGRSARPAAATAKHFKGLLETRLYAPGTAQDDRTVVRTKMAYPAMQAVTSIFDSRLRPLEGRCTVSGSTASVSVYAFGRADGARVLAVWRDGDTPGQKPMHELVDIACPGLRFGGEPRYVDLLTRAAYATTGLVERAGEGILVRGLPIYDSPVLVADAALVTAR